MATAKPSKPDVTLPESFGGVKTPYSDTLIRDGYQVGVPTTVDGGNINQEKDALFQKLKYLETIADAVNNTPPGKFLTVNSNNQFEYADASAKSSFGNIGDIQYTTSTEVPLGGAWCDGALYTKAQFPDVYQMLVDGKIQSTTVTDFDSKVSANGSCGFFGLDTSNERFKVPLLKDVYIKAGQAPSMFGAESLPNITGEFAVRFNADLAKGAFYKKSSGAAAASSEGTGTINGFDASRSSSTYKSGVKVNPDHVVYRAYVVLYSSAAGASEVQAAEFMTALNGKANTDLSNVSSNIDYVVESYQNGTEWYKIYKSGWVEQGGTLDGNPPKTNGPEGTFTINFLKPFVDTNYTVTGACAYQEENHYVNLNFSEFNVDSMKAYSNNGQFWRAEGQGASE